MKNIDSTKDLFRITQILGYKSTFTFKDKDAYLSILRDGMEKFWNDYLNVVKIYPLMSLGKIEKHIEQSLKFMID